MSSLDRTCDPVVDRRIDAFVDGHMSSAERSCFEHKMSMDPDLAAAVELSADVRTSLRRRFSVPDFTTLFERIDAAAAQMKQGGRNTVEGSIRWVAAVATVFFLFLGVSVTSLWTPAAQADDPGMTASRGGLIGSVSVSLAVASAAIASGVRLRREAGRVSLDRRGATISLPAGTRVLRAERQAVIDGGCTLLVERAGQAATLVVAASARDRELPKVWADGRRVFRAERGGFVIYEITAAAGARVAVECAVTPAGATRSMRVA